jgi:hypothetical protein
MAHSDRKAQMIDERLISDSTLIALLDMGMRRHCDVRGSCGMRPAIICHLRSAICHFPERRP